mmetsp:Transcript_25212/g.61173  ORF Transcript_25212/g.61173 Transcript_25212/m.61173 type:complete len:205 (+) Transcript_25212:1283-1897(+)
MDPSTLPSTPALPFSSTSRASSASALSPSAPPAFLPAQAFCGSLQVDATLDPKPLHTPLRPQSGAVGTNAPGPSENAAPQCRDNRMRRPAAAVREAVHICALVTRKIIDPNFSCPEFPPEEARFRRRALMRRQPGASVQAHDPLARRQAHPIGRRRDKRRGKGKGREGGVAWGEVRQCAVIPRLCARGRCLELYFFSCCECVLC